MGVRDEKKEMLDDSIEGLDSSASRAATHSDTQAIC